jgi:hypothetical protein
MARVDELTAQTKAQTLATDVLYVGRAGDPDPDRQIPVGELLGTPKFGADDTTGMSVADGSPVVIPAGVWYAHFPTNSEYVEVYVNGGWQMVRATNDLRWVLVFSDGTSARAGTVSPSGTVYLRQVL